MMELNKCEKWLDEIRHMDAQMNGYSNGRELAGGVDSNVWSCRRENVDVYRRLSGPLKVSANGDMTITYIILSIMTLTVLIKLT